MSHSVTTSILGTHLFPRNIRKYLASRKEKFSTYFQKQAGYFSFFLKSKLKTFPPFKEMMLHLVVGFSQGILRGCREVVALAIQEQHLSCFEQNLHEAQFFKSKYFFHKIGQIRQLRNQDYFIHFQHNCKLPTIQFQIQEDSQERFMQSYFSKAYSYFYGNRYSISLICFTLIKSYMMAQPKSGPAQEENSALQL